MNAPIRPLLVVLVFLVAAPLAPAAELAPGDKLTLPLRDALEAAGAGELVPVSIVLGDQLEGERLLARVPSPLQGRARQRAVIDALKGHAGLTQGRVLSLLETARLEGKAQRVRPLWIGNVVGADLEPEQILLVAELPEVARINYNPKTEVFLERPLPVPALTGLADAAAGGEGGVAEIECGTDLMRAPEIWNDLGFSGEGAVIAVIDTGVCWYHPDIENQIWVNPGEDLDGDGVVMDPDDENGLDDDANGFVDDLIGWDFDIGDNDPNDDSNGHGSHCAGTVAGDGTSGTQSGMAPDAKIMVLRVGVTFADEVDVWNGMQYAADNGADSISMSLGWPHGNNPDRATWRTSCENTIEAGTAMVIAAGNEGQGNEPDNVRTPGDVPRIISVGATDCDDAAASFSSRGPVTWEDVPPWNDWSYPPGLIKPDVSAPGVSTKSHNFCSGYTNKSGTSMATPHVAGAVALMKSTNPGLTHDDLKLILEETAIDLGAAGKDNTFGSGRVDAYEAVLRSGSSDGIVRMDGGAYSCADSIGILVADKDLAAAGTVAVEISSATETVAETVTLTETGASSGVFRGSIPTDAGDPAADGVLQVAHGDLIEVLYVDADDGQGGTDVEKRDQADADCRGPFISLVRAEDIDDQAATLRWSTDEVSTSDALYGTVRPPTMPASSGGLTADHGVRLTGLPECSIVYYEVSSTDPQGNAVSDDNGGAYYYFETFGNFPGVGIVPCHAGQVDLDAEVYSCEDSLTATVVDIDLNQDTETVETVEVTITSSTETEPETLLLVETGPNTSQFRGTIAIAPGAPAPDGIVQSSDGDLLTATYRDESDGTGAPGLSAVSALADCGGPSILNLRVESLTDARGTVRFETSEAATATLDWGTTPGLGETETFGLPSTSFGVVLNQFDLCDTVYLRVRATDAHGNSSVSDMGGSPFHFNTYEIPGLYWKEGFEGAGSGWALAGEWEIGEPKGLGGSSGQADPTEAYNNRGVLGVDLSGLGSYPGDYEPGAAQDAGSPTLDGTTWTNTKLIMYRRLNAGSGDDASLWLFTDSGVPIFGTRGDPVTETGFQYYEADIAGKADGASAVRLVFKQGADASGQYSSWNVDDLIFKDGSLPDYGACADCSSGPSFGGIAEAEDAEACAPGGVTLSWLPAVSWGTGSGGSYAVYRDTAPGFLAGPATLVASGVGTPGWTDPTAPQDTDLYYVVRAETDEACSTGPNNGGVLDGNLAERSARDTLSQPLPAFIDTVLVRGVNGAHVRLEWNPVPEVTGYRVYRAEEPDMSGAFLLQEAGDTYFEDVHELGTAKTYFYRVQGVNACGQE